MAQTTHPIIDTDPHFIVDPRTRALSTESKKVALMQGDHNSERFTFELPLKVEEHPMQACDKVEVHFINIDQKTKEESAAVYVVADLATEGDDTLTFSWLVSHQATKFVGPLSFRLRFVCLAEDGSVEYAWHSAIYQGITVSAGIDNGEAATEYFDDVLEKWIRDMESNQIVSLEQTQIGEGDEDENIWRATFGDGRTSELKVKNGSKGATGLIGSIETVNGETLHFFHGTADAFDGLPDSIKQLNLFAIITDDTTEADILTAVERLSQLDAGLQDGTVIPHKAFSAEQADSARLAECDQSGNVISAYTRRKLLWNGEELEMEDYPWRPTATGASIKLGKNINSSLLLVEYQGATENSGIRYQVVRRSACKKSDGTQINGFVLEASETYKLSTGAVEHLMMRSAFSINGNTITFEGAESIALQVTGTTSEVRNSGNQNFMLMGIYEILGD